MSVSALWNRRILVSGSIGKNCDEATARYAHAFLAALTHRGVASGASYVVPIDTEPRLVTDDHSSPAKTFDWTVLEAAWEARARRPIGSGLQMFLIVGVTHNKALGQIPDDRKVLWNDIRSSSLLQLVVVGEWNIGSIRREAQARVGDILIALGGSEGVKHLANLFHDQGKPVIPLDLSLGLPKDGAELLHAYAMAQTPRFFRVQHRFDATALLAAASLRALPRYDEAADRCLTLLKALQQPQAFCVRLLNGKHPLFGEVDWFFNNVAIPVAQQAGYECRTVGVSRPDHALTNVEIFSQLRRSQLVIADYTGHRANCFIELGFALGRGQRILLTASEGTERVFDVDALQIHYWDPRADLGAQRASFWNHWQREIDRGPIVPESRLV